MHTCTRLLDAFRNRSQDIYFSIWVVFSTRIDFIDATCQCQHGPSHNHSQYQLDQSGAHRRSVRGVPRQEARGGRGDVACAGEAGEADAWPRGACGGPRGGCARGRGQHVRAVAG